MREERDYIREITEIRSMMERTSKFLSLSGWAGVMAGVYALVAAYLAYDVFHFRPDKTGAGISGGDAAFRKVIVLALVLLVLTIGTAVLLSHRKAAKRNESLWNATSRRLLIRMAVPLVTGGLVIMMLIAKGLIGLIAPFTLIFYGLALYDAGKVTYAAVRTLGLLEIGLGLIGIWFAGYGLLCWTIGFGLLHVIYGIYIHYRYER